MELISSTGTSLALTIDGYQFPHLAPEAPEPTDDSNWLSVEGRVTATDRTWGVP